MLRKVAKIYQVKAHGDRGKEYTAYRVLLSISRREKQCLDDIVNVILLNDEEMKKIVNIYNQLYDEYRRGSFSEKTILNILTILREVIGYEKDITDI